MRGERDRPAPKRTEWAAVLLLAVLLGIAVFTSYRGIDFGFHWDEDKLLRAVARSVQDGLVLPRWYNYPSFSFDVGIVGLLTKSLLHRSETTLAGAQDTKAWLVATAMQDEFKLYLRRIFAAISYLSVVWVYAAVRVLRDRPWEALLAAALVALSWEVQYHSRWIAPDAVVMQFAALTLFCCAVALRGRRWGPWLVAASVSAGLACATKYQAGALLLLVWTAAALRAAGTPEGRAARVRRAAGWAAASFVLLCGAFLLTTPGALVQPLQFVRDVAFEIDHYGVAGHGGYTVSPGPEHFARMLAYYATTFFSKYHAVAALFFVMALVGVGVLFRTDRRVAILLASLPVFFLLYMSWQRVLIARNLLILAPFFAAFAAAAATGLGDRLRRPRSRWACVLAVAGMLAGNAYWLHEATDSIVHRSSASHLRALVDFMEARPGTRFLGTRRIKDALALPGDASTAGSGGGEATAVLYMSDVTAWKLWRANHPYRYRLLRTGPWEVNFDYYPTWSGDDRIVMMPARLAEAMGLSLLELP